MSTMASIVLKVISRVAAALAEFPSNLTGMAEGRYNRHGLSEGWHDYRNVLLTGSIPINCSLVLIM